MTPDLTAKLFVVAFTPLGLLALAGWGFRLWLAHRRRQRSQ